MRNRLIQNGLIVICSLVFLFSLFQIGRMVMEYRVGSKTYNELEEQVSVTVETIPEQEKSESRYTKEIMPVEEVILWPEVNFTKLQEINPEIIAWLYSEGTVISYPVAHTDNNDYYLTHMFNGKINKAGCLFLDAWNMPDFSDENSIIHGHHMKNDSMFGSLMGYKKQEYYEKHPFMQLLTPNGNYIIEIFSGFVVSDNENAWALWFESDEKKQEWLNWLCRKSSFDSGIVPELDDRIVTLSTCSYEFDNARFVLYGILRSQK